MFPNGKRPAPFLTLKYTRQFREGSRLRHSVMEGISKIRNSFWKMAEMNDSKKRKKNRKKKRKKKKMSDIRKAK